MAIHVAYPSMVLPPQSILRRLHERAEEVSTGLEEESRCRRGNKGFDGQDETNRKRG